MQFIGNEQTEGFSVFQIKSVALPERAKLGLWWAMFVTQTWMSSIWRGFSVVMIPLHFLCPEHLLRTSSTSRPASLPRVPAMESAKSISGKATAFRGSGKVAALTSVTYSQVCFVTGITYKCSSVLLMVVAGYLILTLDLKKYQTCCIQVYAKC